MERIHLIGAEDVRTAANTMRAAAEDMRSAANSMDYSLTHNQQFMNDWLQRLEAALDRFPKEPTP